MATVRDGIYLEDNPPARSQFRVGRRDPVKSVIVVHTADATLVANKHDEEQIRQVVKELETRGWTEYL